MNHSTEHGRFRIEKRPPNANRGLLAWYCLGVEFAGKLVAQPSSVCAGNEVSAVMIIGKTIVFPDRPGFIGVFLDARRQCGWAGIVRLRDHSLATQQIAHDDLHCAASTQRGQFIECKGTGRNIMTRNEFVIHHDIDCGRHDRFPADGLRRVVVGIGLGCRVGRKLNAPKSHRSSPATGRAGNGVTDPPGGTRFRAVPRPGAVQTCVREQ